jgi:hypothetical protein
MIRRGPESERDFRKGLKSKYGLVSAKEKLPGIASVPTETRFIKSSTTPTERENDKRPQHGRIRYDPRRPDFMDVAGGFPDLTGGAGGGCCTFVTSGTP